MVSVIFHGLLAVVEGLLVVTHCVVRVGLIARAARWNALVDVAKVTG